MKYECVEKSRNQPFGVGAQLCEHCGAGRGFLIDLQRGFGCLLSAQGFGWLF